MKQNLLTKVLLLFALIVGSASSVWAEDITETLTIKGWGSYTTNSYSSSNTDYTGNGATTNVSYAMRVFNGSTGQPRGNQSSAESNFSCRNKTTKAGYYIKQIKINKGGGDGTFDGSASGRSIVYLGASAFSAPSTTPSGTAISSTENASGQSTLTWDNTDQTASYFILYHLKTSGTVSGCTIDITWAECDGPAVPSISAENVNITTCDATSGAINYSISNEVTGGSLSANVTGGNEGNWLTLGTIGATSIPFTATANNAFSERTATVTLTYTYNTNETVTKDVTVTQAAYVAPFEGATYTLASSITPGKRYIIVGKNGDNVYAMGGQKTNNREGLGVTEDNNMITSDEKGVVEFVISNSGDNYTIYDEAESGYLYAASNSSNHLKTEDDLDNNDNGLWAITFNNDGYASIVAQGSNGRNVMRFNYNNGTPLFSCYASSSTTGTSVYLYEKVVTATIASSGYTTFCSSSDLSFENVTGLTAAYVVSKSTDEVATLKRVTAVPAGKGVVLKGTPEAAVTIPVVEYTGDDIFNLLVGTLEETPVDPGTVYVVSGGKFKIYDGESIPANKAYLPLDAIGQGAPSLSFEFDDETTGIQNIERTINDNQYYTLDGRRVAEPTKGIYIINGKKVVIK